MEIEDKKQWHPAFCAAIELEFREDKEALQYEREHNLSKKPLQIDLLVIKKEPNKKLKNEIGDFFLGHNIMEYKSPGDNLNIDDLYKVLGYACIYKSETGGLNEILDTDITVSLIRENKPRKLFDQLSAKYKMEEKASGIYRVNGMLFPLQIIVTKKLDQKLHAWLHSLTRSMKYTSAENLLHNCESLENTMDKKNAGVVIDFVSNVNESLFLQILEEDEHMTDALKTLIEPELINLRLIINNKDAEIADNKAKLADKDAEIANKNAEIAKLKQQLLEATQQHNKS